MTDRIALAAASAGAAMTFAAALVVAAFAPASSVTTAGDTSAATDVASTPTIQVDTIYVAPPPPQETITIHKIERTSAGESDDENESGGED
jgi:hypothetical protein